MNNNSSTDQPVNKITIGLVGFGVVGKGLYDVLQATPGLQASVKKICIKDPLKKRAIDASYFTTEFGALLNDESINVIAELIDDADAAYEIVKASLKKGKSVVSANKKMIAAHFEELLWLQKENNVSFLYEACCCAGIPVIRNLEEYYDNDMLSRVCGIINGSTNFMLSKIFEEKLSFEESLHIAQQAGFAESNPSLDTEGHDAANKLCILTAHAFGTIIRPEDILYTGITAVTVADAAFAAEKNCNIKLKAHAKKVNAHKIAVFVLPQLIKKDSDFYNVRNEFNALETESCFADRHFFKGKGAGAFPTAAAVLSDIAALRYGYRYEYRKIFQQPAPQLSHDFFLNVSVSADDIRKINTAAFSHIDKLQQNTAGARINGTISAAQLAADNWWKQNSVSLLLAENEFAEPRNPVNPGTYRFNEEDISSKPAYLLTEYA